MSLMIQAYLLDRYGPRLDVEALGETLRIASKTVLNQVSAKAFPIPTYLDQGKRWADARNVADYFDACRATAR